MFKFKPNKFEKSKKNMAYFKGKYKTTWSTKRLENLYKSVTREEIEKAAKDKLPPLLPIPLYSSKFKCEFLFKENKG